MDYGFWGGYCTRWPSIQSVPATLMFLLLTIHCSFPGVREKSVIRNQLIHKNSNLFKMVLWGRQFGAWLADTRSALPWVASLSSPRQSRLLWFLKVNQKVETGKSLIGKRLAVSGGGGVAGRHAIMNPLDQQSDKWQACLIRVIKRDLIGIKQIGQLIPGPPIGKVHLRADWCLMTRPTGEQWRNWYVYKYEFSERRRPVSCRLLLWSVMFGKWDSLVFLNV